MEELVDIYDANREPTGRVAARNGLFLAEGEYMLYVLAVVQDAQGRCLITQRTFDKRWAPGAWEVPGGGAHAGETSWQAVVREVREEVGLDVSAQKREPIYSYDNVDLARGDNYFVDIYLFDTDATADDVVLQESEALDCAFATWACICDLADEGRFLHFERLKAALGMQ